MRGAEQIEVVDRRHERRMIRLGMTVQKSRVACYTLAGIIATVCVATGVLEADHVGILSLILAAYATAAIFFLFHKWQLSKEHYVDLSMWWIACDALLISWGVHISGGADSPWFPWYLANISGAAFVIGELGAGMVALVDTIAYLGVLYLRGDITSFGPELYRPLTHMIFLYAASFFFLKGVGYLRVRHRQIQKLRDDEGRKLDELKRLAAELDSRTRELQATNLELREATRLKSQFLANMSHELRTPLNSIIGFSEILVRKLSRDINAKHLKFLGNIHSAGLELLEMINDILDLAKIEVGRMELQPGELTADSIINGVIRIAKGGIKERRLKIETDLPDEPITFEGDPARIKQILFHLLANAIKFSPDAASVTIRVRAVPAADSKIGIDSVELAVIDQGIGIDPRDHYLIFEEFRQIDGSSTRRFEGAGLGLALVKKFVELHHGIVTVDSALGRGSTFTVLLPQRFRGHADHQPAITDATSIEFEGERRILVVEDDPSAYENICKHLATTNYQPVRAHNGHEAIEMVQTVQPLAIILDIVLPGIDGWEVLKRLKAEPYSKPIPVIIVSMLENRELGLALGADDYFTKPVDGDLLCSRLSEILLPPGVRGARVLVIDDDPAVHEVMEAELGPRGYRLLHALAGREGFELAVSQQPDLLILDLMMEEMDGFEVAALLKTRKETAELPIVVLTAKDLTIDDRDRLRGKIEALLQKAGSSNTALVSVVESLLARRAQQLTNGAASANAGEIDDAQGNLSGGVQ